MTLPFTTGEFLAVFSRYNLAVWPAQILLTALALAMVAVLFLPSRHRSQLVYGGLALLWTWTAVAYHFLFFARINPAARVFGAVSLVAAVIFALQTMITRTSDVPKPAPRKSIVGGSLIVYALVLYPLINWLTGHHYPATPTFGLPCPTTIFTLGALLLTRPLPPGRMFVVPLLWTVVGSTAALQLGIYADLGLLFAGVATLIVLLNRREAGHHLVRAVEDYRQFADKDDAARKTAA